MTKSNAREELARYDAERQAEVEQAKADRVTIRQNCGDDPAAIQALLDDIDAERQELFEKRRPIDERLLVLHRETAAAKDVLGEARMAKMKGQPDWPFLLDIRNDSNVVHKAWENAVHSIGLLSQGYNPETNQRGVSLRLTKGDPESVQRTVAGIKTLIPLLKPDDDGWVALGILEHTLSANGSFEMKVRPDLTAMEVGRVCGYANKEFDNLEAAVSFVQKNYWYEKAPEERSPGLRR